MTSRIMRKTTAVVLAAIAMVAMSCAPNCREVVVQVADWQTRYENYWKDVDTVVSTTEMVDTMVAYEMDKYYIKKNYFTNSGGNVMGATCTHYIRIKNTNDTYSNRFAIRIDGNEYDDAKSTWQKISKTTNYVNIYPNSTYTFQVTHSAWWRNTASGKCEDDIEMYVLQSPNRVSKTYKKIVHTRKKMTRRLDELVIKDTVVNNCECDVDALKAKSEAVQETFEKLKRQNLIRTK